MMVIKRYVSVVITIVLFLTGCKKDNNSGSNDSNAKVSVSIASSEFENEDSSAKLVRSNNLISNTTNSFVKLHRDTDPFTIPFSDDIIAYATLEDASSTNNEVVNYDKTMQKGSKKAVIQRNPLTLNTRYLLQVYNIAGALVAERLYSYGRESETQELLLDGGSSYDFIALSINSQTADPVVTYTNNVRTLANANVNTTNQDLMVFKERVTLIGGQNNLSVILRHVFTSLTTNLIIDPSVGGNITSATSSTLQPVRSSASYALATQVISYGAVSNTGTNVNFSAIPSGGSKRVSSTPLIFATPSVTNGSLVIPSLTINGTTRSDFTVSNLVFASGKKYNLNLNFRVPCTQTVNSEPFSVSNGQPRTFVAPPANYGFVLDIYTLDNSFNMVINGTQLANNEIQFESGITNYPRNIQFSDGSLWGVGTVPQIYNMTGTATNPIIRITISATGQVSLQGSKTAGGPLFALAPIPGQNLTFRNINWNTNSNNSITITQVVTGTTLATGRGQGQQIVTCPN